MVWAFAKVRRFGEWYGTFSKCVVKPRSYSSRYPLEVELLKLLAMPWGMLWDVLCGVVMHWDSFHKWICGVETHVLFDTEATHNFVSPGLVGKSLFCLSSWDYSRLVRAAGGQIMHSLGLMKNISVQERNLPVDLIEKISTRLQKSLDDPRHESVWESIGPLSIATKFVCNWRLDLTRSSTKVWVWVQL